MQQLSLVRLPAINRFNKKHTHTSDNETRSTEVINDYKPAFISVDKARQAKALHLLI